MKSKDKENLSAEIELLKKEVLELKTSFGQLVNKLGQLVNKLECSQAPRTMKIVNDKPVSTPPDITIWSYIPPACRNCSNHPSNGGSGICHCTLGNTTIY